MSDGITMLVGVSGLLFALVLVGAAAHMYADAGLRVFVWPRLDHTYEIQHAARLAAVPWYILLYLLAVNGLAILFFGRDLRGLPSSAYGFWFVLMLLPILMAHLVDYRRSWMAALVTLVVVAACVAGLVYVNASLVPLALALPLLLWSFNGVRATLADRAFA